MRVIPIDPLSSSSRPGQTRDGDGQISQFRPNTWRTRLTAILLIAQLLLLVIGGATVTQNGATTQLDTTFLQFRLAPITLAAFCAWMYRAYSNLIPLGARGLRSSPRKAVISIFIPCVNFVVPFRALAEIARSCVPLEAELHPVSGPNVGSIPLGSNPAARSFLPKLPLDSSGGSISLGWAWAAFVNLILFNGTVSEFIKKNIGVPVVAIEDFSDSLQSLLWAQFLIALFLLVRGINARQEERRLRLSAEAECPHPTY
jgi:Domain of unknown function (DUF4328)